MDLIKRNQAALSNLFKSHQVERAFVFGSVTSETFNSQSDLDFIIKFKIGIEPLRQGELWWNLHDGLRELFDREIDLINESSLRNPYFIQEINSHKRLVYGQ